MCLAKYHPVFLNISCSQFVMFVKKIGLCEEKGLSGCVDVTGQQYRCNRTTI
jgi:hypothetical protein